MAKKKAKFYVVWEGRQTGVFNTWSQAKKQIDAYPGAKYKSYESLQEAQQAYQNPEMAQENIKENKKTVYYVVWKGFHPGIYSDWAKAQMEISGFPHPKFKSFGSKKMAEKAFVEGPDGYEGRSFKKVRDMNAEEKEKYGEPNPNSFCVDAACNSTNGVFEYRGVITDSGTEVFRVGPLPEGSNNIGEFLGIVHALAYLKKNRSAIPIYSDSKIAISWVANKQAKTKVTNAKTLDLIKRAEKWLRENEYTNPIIKWQTKFWGEIPADFGRK